jgi:mRNA deadenylase 3'-5' endonuclease subunit Ccr4
VLDAEYRYLGLLKRLESEVTSEAIVCLQEVSMHWAGRLHVFFQKHGYHFVVNNYGGTKNGYMGVGIAFPCHRFVAQDVHFCKLSDNIKTKKRQREGKGSSWASFFGFQTDQVAAEVDEWALAKRRSNVLVYVQLECRSTLASFGVASYHMPCVFWAPKVMVLHTAVMLNETKRLAGHFPYVIAGDFNFVPGSACYRLVTTGRLPPTDPDYPFDNAGGGGYCTSSSSSSGDFFQKGQPRSLAPIEGEGLQSAYMQALGTEPIYTNYAETRENRFRDTLDYIFLSRGDWVVNHVHELPTQEEALEGGSLPNETEPSDHLLLSADLQRVAPRRSEE